MALMHHQRSLKWDLRAEGRLEVVLRYASMTPEQNSLGERGVQSYVGRFLSCIANLSAAKRCFRHRPTSLTAADTFALLEKELRRQHDLGGRNEVGMLIRIGDTLGMPVAAIRGASLCHDAMLCCLQVAEGCGSKGIMKSSNHSRHVDASPQPHF
eukprot:2606950-Amphidinium_carterae.1